MRRISFQVNQKISHNLLKKLLRLIQNLWKCAQYMGLCPRDNRSIEADAAKLENVAETWASQSGPGDTKRYRLPPPPQEPIHNKKKITQKWLLGECFSWFKSFQSESHFTKKLPHTISNHLPTILSFRCWNVHCLLRHKRSRKPYF